MKKMIILALVLTACHSDPEGVQVQTPPKSTVVMKEKMFDNSLDNEKTDEGCATEDELKKEIEAAAKKAKEKPEMISLQGGNTGCSTDAKAE